MLSLTIPDTEFYNEDTNEFFTVKGRTLSLEHSLISISKWESKYCKPFISGEPKSIDETLYYIECMTIDKNVDPRLYLCITDELVEKVNAYIDAPMTATKFYDFRKDRSPERQPPMTSERIYFLMTQANVPVEFEKWHINRLIALLRMIQIETDPNAKKMRGRELLAYNAAENARRKAKYHTKG